MEIVCCLQLADSQVVHHLTPPAMHPAVRRIWVVRSHRPSAAEIPKAQFVLAPARWKPMRFLQMFRHCVRLARRPEVSLVVSFNPFPYGLIGAAAARLAGKPYHFGFIGSDWNREMRRRRGRLLLPLIRRAWLVSVPGNRMQHEMSRCGIDGRRIVALPHGLDLERFPVPETSTKEFDCLFVGRLIPLKRVDVILRAFRRVVDRHPGATMALVGDGPLRSQLETLTRDLDLSANVRFVGHVPQVQGYLARARILVMASEQEGLPYALVEAMCSGLVPVCTPVGEIADIIRDGTNGFLHSGDPEELGALLSRLIGDEELCRRIREEIVGTRSRFGYDAVARAWRPWLERAFPHPGGEAAA